MPGGGNGTVKKTIIQTPGKSIMNDLINQFQQLFEYDFWANQKILTALTTSHNISERMVEIFSHIIGARQLWYQRITGGDYGPQMVWPKISFEECKPILAKNQSLWLDYLAQLKINDLSKKISYATSKGESYETPIHDMLMQVIMHGAYHRGQIAILMRHANVQPPATDYIYYVRKK